MPPRNSRPRPSTRRTPAFLEALESRILFTTTISLAAPAYTTTLVPVPFIATVSTTDNFSLEGLSVDLYRDGQQIASALVQNGQATLPTTLSQGDHLYTARLNLDDARPNPGTLGSFADSFYEAVKGNLSWDDASSAAQSRIYAGRHGRLVTIASAAEDAVVSSIMGVSTGNFWIGGLQAPGSAEPAGGWRWVTDEPMTYTNWRYDEPNNYWGPSRNEDHILKHVADQGTWGDYAGSDYASIIGYVVEYAPDNALPSPGTVTSSAVDIVGSIPAMAITLNAPPSGYAAAASLFTATVATSDLSPLDGYTLSLLCDGQDIAAAPIHGNQASFTVNLAVGDHVYSARLNLADNLANPAAASTFRLSGSYYQVVKGSMTWDDASTAAQSLIFAGRHGRLVTITSAAEDAFVNALMGVTNDSYWIGGLQTPGSAEPAGGWHWVTNEPMTYLNWRYDEPNNFWGPSTNEDRLLKRGPDSGAWGDYANSESRSSAGYIVEYPPENILYFPNPSLSDPVTVTGWTTPTTITVSVPSLSLAYGASADVTIQVQTAQHTLVTAGSITLRNVATGAAVLTKFIPASGITTFTFQGSSTGPFNYLFEFLPAGQEAIPSSVPFSLFVQKLQSALSLSTLYGNLQFSLSPANASGTVALFDHGSFLQDVTLSGNTATLDLSRLPAGAHDFTATYLGNDIYLPADSLPLSVTTGGRPTLTLSSSSVPYGSPFTLTVTMAPGTTGNISFIDAANNNNHSFGFVTMAGGTATFVADSATTDYLTLHDPGIHHILAFWGSASSPYPYNALWSDPVDFQYTPLTPSIRLTQGPTNAATGNVQFSVTGAFPFAGANPFSSMVSLRRNGVVVSEGYISPGTPTFTFTLQGPLSGDYDVVSHANGMFTEVVSNHLAYSSRFVAPPTVLLTAPAAVRINTSAQLKAIFSRPISGTVQFYEDSTLLGQVAISNQSEVPWTITPPPFVGSHQYSAKIVSSSFWQQPTASAGVDIRQPTVIDLLALYTLQSSIASNGAIFSRIQQAVADANTAYFNSNIPLALRLVAMVPVNYSESGDLSTDLTRLSTLNDGYLDNVTSLRNTFHADLTALFVSKASPSSRLGFETVGIATELYNPAAADSAAHSYLVVAQNHYNDYTLAHEVGHTLGATHAVGDDTDTGATPYAHGYRFYGNDGTLYHDIMAYYPGTQVPYFSDPSLTYAGVPLGTPSSANSARVIRSNAPVIAAYRSSPITIGALESASYRTVSGWALDPKRLFAGAQLQITVDGKTLAVFSAEQNRRDLIDLFGVATHGFSYTLPRLAEGAHTVAIYIIDSETGKPILLGQRTVTAPPLLFDEAYYLAKYPDIAKAVAAGKFTAWDHYRIRGQFELRTPSDYFDPAYYLAKNPDLARLYAAKKLLSPWAHYYTTGQYENRTASLWFDPHFYRLANPALAAAVAKGTLKSLVNHFIGIGQYENRSPIPYFNAGSYLASPHFQSWVKALAPGETAYENFLTYGNRVGIPPCFWFSPINYLQDNPSVSALIANHTVISALDHYIRFGLAAGIQLNYFYSESSYLAHNPDIAAAVAKGTFTSGFEHFVLWGYKEGRTAT